MKKITTLLLTIAILFAGVLTAPAVLDAAGVDASGADLAPGASAREVEQCAGGERPEPGDPKPMIVPGQCVGVEIRD